MRLVVFGAGGLLGRTAVALAPSLGLDVAAALSRAECDVADEAAVARALESAKAEVVLNASAYTDVDRAEREPAACARVNATAPGVLARAAERAGARLVHISTDYVFDGAKGRPYVERDEARPLASVYARTKLEGERAALAAQPRAIVARTAWLYGAGGKNFVSKMPAILREKGEIAAVADQRSSPTRADELLRGIVALLRSDFPGGVVHVAAQGSASYHEVALEAALTLGVPLAKVRATSGASLVRPAPRPDATPLASEVLPKLGIAMRPWAEAYREFAGG